MNALTSWEAFTIIAVLALAGAAWIVWEAAAGLWMGRRT